MRLKSSYSWDNRRSVPAQQYIEGYLRDSEHGSGRLETLERELENCREMISYLVAALLEAGVVDLKDVNMGDVEVEE